MTTIEEKYTQETILWVKNHTPKHISFAITRPKNFRFSAGQFARLGFAQNNGFIWRAYSMVSAEYDDFLEFYAILIPGGPFSQHFETIKTGDTFLLEKIANGFFLPERFQDGQDLVMLSTGSGLAPFLSILKQPSIWSRFQNLSLVHCVSYISELVYQETIQELQQHELFKDMGAKLKYQPVVTREHHQNCLNERLPICIQNGELEKALEQTFNVHSTRFMICGNPQMVTDTHKVLMQKGFSLNRVKLPGQILLENGF
ncbi:ferredoxin--NADP reductase [Neisseria sp. Ec49-e6-T10]|uniref:ferredoxin--NADP reductase n=1 Tax=Neisseria sp. Ec49-e6-T10 TaxID=3140744 RepID=UPI003EBCEB14